MNDIEYIAHVREDGMYQTIAEHSENVAELCRSFSFDELKQIAYLIGLLHDIGKYSNEFQQRIRGKNISVEHSLSGAKEALNIIKKDIISLIAAYCIAGHHSGIPDGGNKSDTKEDSTLLGRLKRKEPDYSYYRNELKIEELDLEKILNYFLKINESEKTNEDFLEKYAFIIRYLFSCLTDADFLDTEKFCNYFDRGLNADFKKCLELINKEIEQKPCITNVQFARKTLQSQAFDKTNVDAEIYLMNMPTGSGKTLCSMKFALERAILTGKKRIIYVIPYTSIIEQTAQVFEEIFGEHAQILQHHSNYSYDTSNSEDESTSEKMKKATENWDAPIIITTNIQFFQSIYDYKSSKLRKLHNMGDSIIIFDEVHLMPVEYLQPCLRAIGYITEILNSQALFLTATMPNYCEMFSSYCKNAKVLDLIDDKSLFSEFNNCTYNYIGICSIENILDKSENYESSLIIVNNRKTAKQIYNMCCRKKYHLSTYMTNYDRTITINKIRQDLKDNVKITVVSTSLIEAGVDLDFESVFRELAGLDSIIQSAGRCNREGKRKAGYMFIFEFEDVKKPRRSDLGIRANITRGMIKNNQKDGNINISSAKFIEAYYDKLYGLKSDVIRKNSISSKCGNKPYLPFKTYAEDFKMIDTDTIAIIIDRNEESHELIKELKFGGRSVRRKLQKYTSNVHIWEFEDLYKQGVLDDYGTGAYCLTNSNFYKEETGLCFDDDNDYIV